MDIYNGFQLLICINSIRLGNLRECSKSDMVLANECKLQLKYVFLR